MEKNIIVFVATDCEQATPLKVIMCHDENAFREHVSDYLETYYAPCKNKMVYISKIMLRLKDKGVAADMLDQCVTFTRYTQKIERASNSMILLKKFVKESYTLIDEEDCLCVELGMLCVDITSPMTPETSLTRLSYCPVDNELYIEDGFACEILKDTLPSVTKSLVEQLQTFF